MTPQLQQVFPPFRAEHVGSLLRPAGLLDLRRRFARGEIDEATLIAAEDRAIEDAIALQARVGLRLATDGEFRRQSYHGYFYGRLGDIVFEAPAENGPDGRGAQPTGLDQKPHRLEGSDPRSRLCLPAFAHQGAAEDHHPGSMRAALSRRRCGGEARPITTSIEFWDDIVTAFHSELRALASGRMQLCADRRDGVRKIRRCRRCARCCSARGDDPDALIDTIHRDHQPRGRGLPDLRIGMHSAAAIAPGNGTPKAATRRWPTNCSTRLAISISSSSNTTRRAPAISRRCGSCRRTNRSCSAWSPPR